MLLKKLTIENFRQYKDKQEIIFSTDKDKNVTLVIGDNGTGKTTISQAFIWCLYGSTPTFQKKDSLLSSKVEQEMNEGWTRNVSVSIEMEHDKKEFTITRQKRYEMKNGKIISDNPYLSVTTVENGATKFLEGIKPDELINEILPQDLSQYFFLSGEKIDSMSTDIRAGKSKDFENAVNTLLDLDYIKDAIKHLTAISRDLDTENTFQAGRTQLAEINEKILNRQKDIDRYTEEIESSKKSYDYAEEQIAEIKAQLAQIQSSKEYIEERNRLEKQQQKDLESIAQETTQGIQAFSSKAPFYFSQHFTDEMLRTLECVVDDTNGDIPEKLHADLIDWIEHKGECICGSKVCKDDELYKMLEKWRRVIPPESIGTLISKFKPRIFDKKRLGQNLDNNLSMKQSNIIDRQEDIENIEEKIRNIDEKLKTTQDTSALQQRLINYTDDKTSADQKRIQAERNLAVSNTKLAEAKSEQRKLLEKDENGRKLLKIQAYTNALINGFENLLQDQKNKKRTLLIHAVKKAFSEIYGNTFSVTIDEQYHVFTDNELEKSQGQGMSVIFAFLAGLLDVIKNNKTQIADNSADNSELETYPLVLDAPFSALDETRISNICEVLPRVSEQIIIFIKDTDGNIAKEEMKDKIGAYYHLIKVNNSEEETKIVEEE